MVNKRGRPPVDVNRTKAEFLEVRLDFAEKQAFQEAAELSGIALSAWVRERLKAAAREEASRAACRAIIVPVMTLEPEPYDLLHDIKVVVRPYEDSFVATYVDAPVSASGDTLTDAVANLKDMMVAMLELLEKEPKHKLGKGPVRQLAALRAVMRKRN